MDTAHSSSAQVGRSIGSLYNPYNYNRGNIVLQVHIRMEIAVLLCVLPISLASFAWVSPSVERQYVVNTAWQDL